MEVESGQLPPLGWRLFPTDGGLETFLIFHRGLDLPEFAAFDLLKDEAGREELRDYYRPFVSLAIENDVGFILESPTCMRELTMGVRQSAMTNRPSAMPTAMRSS